MTEKGSNSIDRYIEDFDKMDKIEIDRIRSIITELYDMVEAPCKKELLETGSYTAEEIENLFPEESKVQHIIYFQHEIERVATCILKQLCGRIFSKTYQATPCIEPENLMQNIIDILYNAKMQKLAEFTELANTHMIDWGHWFCKRIILEAGEQASSLDLDMSEEDIPIYLEQIWGSRLEWDDRLLFLTLKAIQKSYTKEMKIENPIEENIQMCSNNFNANSTFYIDDIAFHLQSHDFIEQITRRDIRDEGLYHETGVHELFYMHMTTYHDYLKDVRETRIDNMLKFMGAELHNKIGMRDHIEYIVGEE